MPSRSDTESVAATATAWSREGPPPGADFKTRIKWAQELVRGFSKNDYSVDDFIRDRRAEAAREERESDR